LATFTVTKTADDGTANTLRWAIGQANGNPGHDQITFNIMPMGTGKTITLDATRGALPAIIETMTIDGFTQGMGQPIPWIEINGNNITGDGLAVDTSNVTIQGLAINRFNGHGIVLNNPAGSLGNVIVACHIGTDLAGTAAGPGNFDGILIKGPKNKIGDPYGTRLTVISGNAIAGIAITGATATENWVQNCHIGVDKTGLIRLENGAAGVYIDEGASNNYIGATPFSGFGNVISGNARDGVSIKDSGQNKVLGNYIGLGKDGVTQLGNTHDGIRISGNSTNNEVRDFNVISSNGRHGIRMDGSGVSGTKIYGNYIGTTVWGDEARSNALHGVNIQGALANWVGGLGSGGEGNVISGNIGDGIHISGNQNNVVNNLIGTTASGKVKLANGSDGVEITGSNNYIGLAGAFGRNVISGNTNNGVRIVGGTSNKVLNNYIGIKNDGSGALGNVEDGVFIESGNNNWVGGTGVGQGNVISGNGDDGVYIGTAATLNYVAGNLIGTNPAGTGPMPNGHDGIEVKGNTNYIGRSGNTGRNTISANARHGIYLVGASYNELSNNYIGTTSDGKAGVAPAKLGNGSHGIFLD
jgi:parallel beta-helix repeat protein